jgi:UDP-N-acetylmuramoyl-tripeptide--D-alanyl-D-alanine ligase
VLSKKYNTAYTQSNLNNHLGVPLTLLSIKKEHEIAIIEMGANHPGEIAALCHIADPKYGLITNIGKAHLEGFGTVKNIIETKTALYRAANVLFVNEEDEVLRDAVNGMPSNETKKEIIFFGKNNLHHTPQITPYLAVELFGNKIQTQLTGNYNIPNILAAATIGRYFGVPEQDICNAIAEYTPTNNRSQIIKTKTNTIIADCYNANPTSMQAALENFLQMEATNKLAILGDMLELGSSSAKEHQALIDFCETNHLETIFIGTHFYSMKNNHFKFFTYTEECNRYLETHKIENTLILLKGSRGIHLEKIIIL